MRIYIKDIKNIDESLGVINTKGLKEPYLVIPEIGDIILGKYKVISRDWEKLEEKLVIWVEPIVKDKISIKVYKEVQKGFMKKEPGLELLETKYINISEINLLPRTNDILEEKEKLKVKSITRKGGLNTKEIIILVEKI